MWRWLCLHFGVDCSFNITGTSAFPPHLWPPHVFPFSLRRVYVINKEVCVRTVCAHEELLRGGLSVLCVLMCVFAYGGLLLDLWPLCLCLADLCRDQFSRCGVAALSGQCASLGGSCGKSCGGCWLSTEIRDTTCPDTAAFLQLVHTLSRCPPPLYHSLLSCEKHFCFWRCLLSLPLSFHMYVCPVDPVCKVKYTPKKLWWLYKSLVL